MRGKRESEMVDGEAGVEDTTDVAENVVDPDPEVALRWRE